MTENRNKLPVAVNVVAGGGDGGRRTTGAVASLSDVSSGSFALGTATRFRIQANLRSNSDGAMIIVGYTNPATLANAEYILTDLEEIRDNVPAGATLYFTLLDSVLLEPMTGGAADYLTLTKYE
jgi:hypothetical protein